MAEYSLIINNESNLSGSFCVFQEPPDVNMPGLVTLAWLAKRANPSTTIAFTWTVDYCFVWSEQGSLGPAARFVANQVVSGNVSPMGLNRIALDYVNGAFKFGPQDQVKEHSDSLYIRQTANVPTGVGIAGIGMSGSGTFVMPTSPNIELIFTPHPKYYVVFGDYEQGDVVDISKVSDVRAIEFRGGYNIKLTFDGQNLWI